MYLKAIEIQGFKSFPDKTRLTFEKNITAIVGPNGSGKSNIADAILWVMGEQRTKALRGSRMEDVIFGGTEKRGALGFAQVSLVIDNSARIFDSDSSEIMLTRRYYRSGESEYYINRESVRLKDLNSLLMDTGLGRDGYSIIGQGRIAEIVSTRSTDRREVFEEAAGISRYRYRKEEAERKLQRTEENLLRINDKIEELELQLDPLKKQAETARRYLVLRDELRLREISLWMENLDRLRGQTESVRLEQEQVQRNLEQAKAELEALYASSGGLTERMHRKDVESEQARERLSAQEAAIAQCEAAAAVLRSQIQNGEEGLERLRQDFAQQENRAAQVRAGLEEGRTRLEEIGRALKDLEEKSGRSENVIQGCRMKLASREALFNQLTERAADLAVEGRSMDARVQLLSAMEKEYEGYSKAVRTVMREKSRGSLKGIHAPAANLVRAEENCALAIETALGAAGQHIVVDSQEDGRRAIELLKRQDAGRATFLPLDTIRGSVLDQREIRGPGLVGVAFHLVRFEEKYREIFANLLGRTVVTETLADAVKLSAANGNRLRIVTLDGQLINPGGSMTGGSAAKGSGILSRANELEKLKQQRQRLAEEEKTCAARLEEGRANLGRLRAQLEQALEKQAELKNERASREAEAGAIRGSAAQLEQLLESLTGDEESRQAAFDQARRQIEVFEGQLTEKEEQLQALRQKAEEIRREIDQIGRSKLELEGRRTKAEKDAQARNSQLLELERQAARVEQRRLSAQMEEKQLLDKLWDSYELSHSEAQALRQPVENPQKAARTIAELRREIGALGTPNLGAIEEHERVSTRYGFLTGQRDDVEKAKGELNGIIAELTGEMKEIFVQRFQEIDRCFRQTFLELFGGGKAALVLEDENDVLQCGIEIKVQPPGKALSTISLLSGGEMAFVAIALYFAILKVRPTPFCVMDEIEAALDEANVARYAAYMRRMADKTQFLVITHRRGTMEEADMLYGVTMQEKGVSTVLELDLEAAQKTIEDGSK